MWDFQYLIADPFLPNGIIWYLCEMTPKDLFVLCMQLQILIQFRYTWSMFWSTSQNADVQGCGSTSICFDRECALTIFYVRPTNWRVPYHLDTSAGICQAQWFACNDYVWKSQNFSHSVIYLIFICSKKILEQVNFI